jgi:mannose-1-phosphate guanylyltransferase
MAKNKSSKSANSAFSGDDAHSMKRSAAIDHTYCIIMAGGKGERFWPVSTDLVPKPFLHIIGKKSLIQLTVERAGRIIPLDRIFVVLGKEHLNTAKEQLDMLPEENFIVEPAGRDTAPCIGYSALFLLNKDKDAVMIVLPADQYIPDVDGFADVILEGVRCSSIGDYFVTIGIKPSRPETGYGYIHSYERFDIIKDSTCYKVNRYVEKPDLKKAMEYLAEGNYYWNGGIFVWRAKAVMSGIERHMPDLYSGLMQIRDAYKGNQKEEADLIFKTLPRKSIDYGLMEKAENVLMIPSRFAWDDVGAWSSLTRVFEPDENGNYMKGDVTQIDTKNCVIFSDDIKVGTIGLSNLIVVASEKGVLVCDINRAQEVREIVKQLNRST